MSDAVIRPADPAEIPAVAELRWRWVLENGGEPGVTHDEYIAYFVAWAARQAGHHCTVAVRDEVVLGMAWLAIVPRVPSPRALERASGDVQCVYLMPSERNSGLGTRMLRVVLDRADELGLDHVTVHSSPGAVHVYQRVGFGTSGTYLRRLRDGAADDGRHASRSPGQAASGQG